jgi:hypothetical protein
MQTCEKRHALCGCPPGERSVDNPTTFEVQQMHTTSIKGAGMAKIRVVLNIDQVTWETFKRILKADGYPRGTASYYVERQFQAVIADREKYGESPQLALFDLQREGKA